MSKPRYLYMDIDNNPLYEMPPQFIARSIYLATYLRRKDGILYKTKYKAMRAGHIGEVLGICDTSAKTFLRETKKYGVLVETDAGYTMPYFTHARNTEDNERITINIANYRNLYKSTSLADSQYIGSIIKLCRNLNLRTNMINTYPHSRGIKKPGFESTKEFFLAIGCTSKQGYVILDKIKNITFNCDGEQQPFCVFRPGKRRRGLFVYVNPKIVYIFVYPKYVDKVGIFKYSD